MKKIFSKISILLLGTIGISSLAFSDGHEVEVLHWWTSGGEAAAVNVLKQDVEKKGYQWVDSPIAGGGGEQAMTTLKARVNANNAPTAVQFLGFDITDWARQGALADLNSVATSEGWDNVVPTALQQFSKYQGKWVAAPVNIHSTNWVWMNKKILDEVNNGQIPTTWNEFISVAKKAQQAGYIGFAHGGQAWQEATVFDGVVLSTGGLDFYRKAFIDLDPAALNSRDMVNAFRRMEELRALVDENFSGRDWNLATAMVIEDKALMQIMGDWAKGEFINAGKRPGVDFVCFRVPGSQGMVSFNADQFAMFKVGAESAAAQNALASSIMAPSFQIAFNIVKGSVPARTDVADTEFDDCGKKGMKDLAEANQKGSLIGSMAHGHAAPAGVKNAVYDVVTAHFNGEYNARQAARELANAVEAAK